MCLKSFASRPTRALGRVLRLIGSPDTRVAMETAVGFQDWGSPKPSSVFLRSLQPSCCDINVRLLLESAPVLNKILVSKLRNLLPHVRELWEQGLWAAELGALGPDVKLEVPNDVFLLSQIFLFFSVRLAASLRLVHVRMLVAGQLETATTNCVWCWIG